MPLIITKQVTYFNLLMILLFLPFSYSVFGQNDARTQQIIDSLKHIVTTSTNDSLRIEALVQWDNLIYLEAPDLDLELNQKIESIALKNITTHSGNNSSYFFATELAYALNNQGIQYENRYQISLALEYYTKSLKIHQKLNTHRGIANAYNNIGNIYRTLYRYKDALNYYHLSLKIRLEIEDTNGTAYAKNNIANIYHEQEKYLDALQYFEQSLELFEALEFKEGTALANLNIGRVYLSLDNFSMSHYYLDKGLRINKEINNYQGIITAYNQICIVYLSKAEIEQESGISKNYYLKTIAYADSAVTLANQYGFQEEISFAYQSFYLAYKGIDNYQKALEYNELYLESSELLKNLENKEAINRNEFALKTAQDSIKSAESKKLYELELKAKNEKIGHDKTTKVILFIGLGMLIIFGTVIYNRFKISQKQKLLIEKQKDEVERTHVELEHKNNEILDSINYAKRIQSAILPPNHYLTNLGIENFILYEPKDIVAGDFYWIEKNGENLYIAAADCTGHGVPGALVSVVCHNALNRAVREYQLVQPGDILNKTRAIIIEEFSKSDQHVKDGMDISMCLVKGLKLFFSGAHNSLWLVRNNAIIEYAADKQPVGQFEYSKPFGTQEIQLEKNDIVYLFSDGYVDQFGGPKGKKFKTKSLKKLILTINNLSLHEQKEALKKEFNLWKGNLEQVDDVCIIGFKIS